MRLIFFSFFLFFCTKIFGQPASDTLSNPEEIRKLALLYKTNGQYDSAEILFIKSLSVFRSSLDSIGTARCMNSIALLYQRMNKSEEALDYFLKAAELNEHLGNTTSLCNNYINLGRFFYYHKNYSKSIEYFLLAKQSNSTNNDTQTIAIIDAGLGSIYSDKDYPGYALDKAQSFYLSALGQFQSLNDSSNVALSYNNIGVVYEKQNNPSQALRYYQKSLEIKQRLGDIKGMMVANLNIGNMVKESGNLNGSLAYYEKAKELASLLQDGVNYLHVITNMVNVKMELGQVDESASLFNEYRALRDSIYNEEKSKQLAELQTLYETEKKDREIAQQKAETEKQTHQNQLLTLLIIIISLLSLATFWFFSQRQRALRTLRNKEDELHQQQVTKLQKEQEIKSLNAMMLGQEQERQRIASDLHDRIGSKLSAIKLFSESGKAEARIGDLLNQTIQETREIAHNLASGILAKFGLALALEDLVNTINATNKIKAHLTVTNIEQRLDTNIESTLYYIIQELLNNTLRHANAENIYIQLTLDRSRVFTMIYEDDGVGFDNNSINGHGMGMTNLHARAASINANISMDSTLGQGQTTIISFTL